MAKLFQNITLNSVDLLKRIVVRKPQFPRMINNIKKAKGIEIEFFRYIRLRLFAENKFSKFLLFINGEIVPLMIGILFALQVNN